eukprot:971152-Prorocentrum_minimum.AAC.1
MRQCDVTSSPPGDCGPPVPPSGAACAVGSEYVTQSMVPAGPAACRSHAAAPHKRCRREAVPVAGTGEARAKCPKVPKSVQKCSKVFKSVQKRPRAAPHKRCRREAVPVAGAGGARALSVQMCLTSFESVQKCPKPPYDELKSAL